MGAVCKKQTKTEAKIRTSHHERINYLSQSQDKSLLIVGQGGNKIKLLDCNSGEMVQRAKGEVYLHLQGYCIPPALSACNRYLAHRLKVCTVSVQDIQNQQEQVVNIYEGVCSLLFSPESDLLLIGSITNNSSLFKLSQSPQGLKLELLHKIHTTNQCVQNYKGNYAFFCNIYSHFREQLLVSQLQNSTLIYETPSMTLLHSLQHPGQVYCNVVSPDGQYMATGTGREALHLWNWADKRLLKELEGSTFPKQTRCVVQPVFSSDSRLLAFRRDMNCVILGMADLEELFVFQWDKAINSICFTPSNRLIALNSDLYTDVYDMHNYKFVQNFKTHSKLQGRLVLFPFFSDELNIMNVEGDQIKKWKVDQLASEQSGHFMSIKTKYIQEEGQKEEEKEEEKEEYEEEDKVIPDDKMNSLCNNLSEHQQTYDNFRTVEPLNKDQKQVVTEERMPDPVEEPAKPLSLIQMQSQISIVSMDFQNIQEGKESIHIT